MGTPRMLLRAAVVAALLACLHSAPALAAPTVTIDSGPEGPTNESSPTFGFTVENETAVECSVDRGTADFGPCTTASSHTDGPLADGDWTFRVRATDDAPPNTTETRDFSVDTVGPVAEVTGPKSTGDRTPSFQVSSPEAGASLTCKLDGKPAVGCGPSFAPDRKLKFGTHKLLVTAHDALGNPGPPTDVPLQGPETAAGGRPRGTNRGHCAPPPQVREAGDRQPRAELHPARPVQVLMPVLLGLPRIPPEGTRTGRAPEGAHLLSVRGAGAGPRGSSSPTRTKEGSRASSARAAPAVDAGSEGRSACVIPSR